MEKKIRVKRNGRPYQLYLPTRLYNLAMRRAIRRYLSLAAWVREAIEEKLSREP